jgi:hypothetical protein
MKNLSCFLAGSLLVLCSYSSSAQDKGSFLIKVTDFNGKPIQKAKAIVMGGQEHWASTGGFIVYTGEDNYEVKSGKLVKTSSSMPLYLTIKAPYYKDQKIELSKYKLGSTIDVKMERLDPDYRSLHVYVKDKDGKPVSGASVLVNPGKSTATDANGYVEAQHAHVIDEWIIVEVYKEGFKKQRQQIKSGDASRNVNGQVIPPSTIYFTLEKGENETTIFHINVEVLDNETNEPVPGASVQLKISDGTIQSGKTNAKGEVKFTDMEYSYQGTTARVVVTKPEYEEKWSDITSDLMTGKDNPERQFLVYLKKDKKSVGTCSANEAAAFSAMSGSWKSYRMHVTISGSCDNVSGTWKVTEWCEGVEETYNASVARVNGTLKGKMQNGYLQLDVEAPPSPNNSKGTKLKGTCSIKPDGTLSCSFGCPGDLKKQ